MLYCRDLTDTQMDKLSNFRIKKYEDGWVSEILIPRWTLFGIKYHWTHFIGVNGINCKPWFFSSRKFAERETILRIKRDIILRSRANN